MKSKRHATILEIISDQVIEIQEELAEKLKDKGMLVTQATISRDIKELRLVKIPTGDGRHRYALPHEKDIPSLAVRLERLVKDSIVNLDYSENLIVIKTLTGNAHAVAAAIDDMEFEGVVGTLAGDDTILVVVRPKDAVAELIEHFNRLRK